MMFGKITIRTKLLIPMFALTIILLFLGGMVIAYSYSQMQSLEKLNNKIILSRYISATLHSLQKKREDSLVDIWKTGVMDLKKI